MKGKFSEDVRAEFEDKNIFVTGGTGSFGNQITKSLLELNPKKIIIFSNDEKQQYDMGMKYKGNEKLKFVFGDVRNFSRLLEVTRGIDIIYHAAALKHVPLCENHPFDAVQTNITGAYNVKMASIINHVKKVVSISTDKAVKPVNVMGMTKAVQERIMLSNYAKNNNTKFVCVRYGNVVGSRGSVIPFFWKRIANKQHLPITDVRMTRFMLTLPEAISLVFRATIDTENDEIFVKKMPACKMTDLAKVMGKELGESDDYPIEVIGIRPGEKIHETLVSEEEMNRVVENEDNYIIYPYDFLKESKLITKIDEYTSFNTRQMDKAEIKELLNRTGWLSKESPEPV
jgi:FlaA1/EpsC-like NDP-sugar epimerase